MLMRIFAADGKILLAHSWRGLSSILGIAGCSTLEFLGILHLHFLHYEAALYSTAHHL